MGSHNACHHHGVQIGIGDHIGMLCLHSDAKFHPSWPRWVLAHLLQYFSRQLPKITHSMSNLELLCFVWTSPSVHRMCDGVLAQQGHVLLVNA